MVAKQTCGRRPVKHFTYGFSTHFGEETVHVLYGLLIANPAHLFAIGVHLDFSGFWVHMELVITLELGRCRGQLLQLAADIGNKNAGGIFPVVKDRGSRHVPCLAIGCQHVVNYVMANLMQASRRNSPVSTHARARLYKYILFCLVKLARGRLSNLLAE